MWPVCMDSVADLDGQCGQFGQCGRSTEAWVSKVASTVYCIVNCSIKSKIMCVGQWSFILCSRIGFIDTIHQIFASLPPSLNTMSLLFVDSVI